MISLCKSVLLKFQVRLLMNGRWARPRSPLCRQAQKGFFYCLDFGQDGGFTMIVRRGESATRNNIVGGLPIELQDANQARTPLVANIRIFAHAHHDNLVVIYELMSEEGNPSEVRFVNGVFDDFDFETQRLRSLGQVLRESRDGPEFIRFSINVWSITNNRDVEFDLEINRVD